MKKTTATLSILLTATLLSGCHQNPLKSHKVRKNTQFLVKASLAASHKLQLNISERSAQNLFLKCFDGDTSNLINQQGLPVSVNCASVYAAMMDFAKSGELSDFKNVRVADLTDEDAIEALREGYEDRVAFGNLE